MNYQIEKTRLKDLWELLKQQLYENYHDSDADDALDFPTFESFLAHFSFEEVNTNE